MMTLISRVQSSIIEKYFTSLTFFVIAFFTLDANSFINSFYILCPK
jgi:hypothetical protein